MCGICGFSSRDPRLLPLEPPVLRRMCAAVRHRGPDDHGQRIEPGAALGMQRLSILDLETGAQPVANEDETVWAVFNGEIYNFKELRTELSGRHMLRTRGDSETIVHLYEDLGLGFVERLRGMFAIALWDGVRRRLVLIRDRMGVKPLYVAETEGGLGFASEIKSLLAGGLVVPSLDQLGAELFLTFGYVPGPRTLFSGVRKLLPASMLIWEDGRLISEERYWTPRLTPDAPSRRSWHEDEEELLERLRASVHGQMVSDVPLGVMLSGGLDSSLVTALMADVSDQPVKTFSIGFQDQPATNELADARRVAQDLGTDHHELLTQAEDHPELLDRMLWHMEEPIADLSTFGFLMISRMARESVKVALSGQGADEILAGYRKHQVAYGAELISRLPPQIRTRLDSLTRGYRSESTRARAVRALTTSDPAERLLAMSRIVGSSTRQALLEPDFASSQTESKVRDVIRQHLAAPGLSALTETLYLDTRLALADQLFLYFDKMSMAASLELRVPFADHDLVSFCLSLPDHRKVWGLRRKELLRRASRDILPRHVLTKRKQGFFRGAAGPWLIEHQEFVSEILLDDQTAARGQFHRGELARMVGGAGRHGIKLDQQLLCALFLELWQRLFVDGGGLTGRHDSEPRVAARPGSGFPNPQRVAG